MNVSLTPELEKWVEARVQSGLYASSSEVVRAALRLLIREEEARTQDLKKLRELLEAEKFGSMDTRFADAIEQMGLQKRKKPMKDI